MALENQLLNATSGHMILGGLCVLFLAPFFSKLGKIKFSFVLSVPFALSCLKETGDWLKWWDHDDSNIKQFMNDVSEWMFGALVFFIMLWILKFYSKSKN